MNSTPTLRLPSGAVIADPLNRMLRFCREEYPYYDALPSGDPDRIEPLDVLAVVAVNGIPYANAEKVRSVHGGLAAACDPLLPEIPGDADLLAVDPPFAEFAALLQAAVEIKWVSVSAATKVLHRKRPAIIPILDSLVLKHYIGRPAPEDKRRAAGEAVKVQGMFRADLAAVRPDVDAVVANLAAASFELTRVRVLEALLWTEVEEKAYYR